MLLAAENKEFVLLEGRSSHPYDFGLDSTKFYEIWRAVVEKGHIDWWLSNVLAFCLIKLSFLFSLFLSFLSQEIVDMETQTIF